MLGRECIVYALEDLNDGYLENVNPTLWEMDIGRAQFFPSATDAMKTASSMSIQLGKLSIRRIKITDLGEV
jgi:hypothetical protein